MTFLKTEPDVTFDLKKTAGQVFEKATTFVTDNIYGEYAQALDDMRLKSVFSFAKAHLVRDCPFSS